MCACVARLPRRRSDSGGGGRMGPGCEPYGIAAGGLDRGGSPVGIAAAVPPLAGRVHGGPVRLVRASAWARTCSSDRSARTPLSSSGRGHVRQRVRARPTPTARARATPVMCMCAPYDRRIGIAAARREDHCFSLAWPPPCA